MSYVFSKHGLYKIQIQIRRYRNIRRDRKHGNRGGCIAFVKERIQYRMLEKGTQLEYMIIEAWTRKGSITIVFTTLSLESMDELDAYSDGKVIW